MNKKLSQKEKYILEQLKLDIEIKLDLDVDMIKILKQLSKDKEISISEMVNLILVKQIMDIQKKDLKKTYIDKDVKIIDMYDMYKIEKFIKSKKKYFIATYTEPIVLIPIKEYEKYIGIVDVKNFGEEGIGEYRLGCTE